jgi:CHASE2 domain-containing sensor protein
VNFPVKFDRARLLAVVVGAGLSIGVGWLLHEFPLGRGLTQASYDLLLVKRNDMPVNEAVLVYMDEISHLRLDQPLNAAWDRALHARIIDRLSASGARAIVFDVVFSEPNPDKPTADKLLSEAMKKSGRVILAADYARAEEGSNKVIPPFDLVRDAAAAWVLTSWILSQTWSSGGTRSGEILLYLHSVGRLQVFVAPKSPARKPWKIPQGG